MTKKIIKNLRKDIITVSYKQRKGHIPSAFSILETVFCIYEHHLNKNDIFLLSKGHGCLALYAVFKHMGYITEEQFFSFGQYDSILGGHPHKSKHEKIYGSTGSLGHGLPMSIGAALAKKLNSDKGRIFCLVGDGECNEGTIWESAILGNKLQLDNLFCIVDDNNSQIRSVPTNKIDEKFASFGWEVLVINDGHDVEKISQAISSMTSQKPKCIVCKTVKGKGIKDMEENMFAWHHGPPNKNQFEKFIEELEDEINC